MSSATGARVRPGSVGMSVGGRRSAIGREAAGQNGIVGRLGGEEFAILLEGADLQAAAAHAELLRARLAELSFDSAAGELSMTCSFGVAQARPGESIDQLLKRADTALYEAKESGRDRVVHHPYLVFTPAPRMGISVRRDQISFYNHTMYKAISLRP